MASEKPTSTANEKTENDLRIGRAFRRLRSTTDNLQAALSQLEDALHRAGVDLPEHEEGEKSQYAYTTSDLREGLKSLGGMMGSFGKSLGHDIQEFVSDMAEKMKSTEEHGKDQDEDQDEDQDNDRDKDNDDDKDQPETPSPEQKK